MYFNNNGYYGSLNEQGHYHRLDIPTPPAVHSIMQNYRADYTAQYLSNHQNNGGGGGSLNTPPPAHPSSTQYNYSNFSSRTDRSPSSHTLSPQYRVIQPPNTVRNPSSYSVPALSTLQSNYRSTGSSSRPGTSSGPVSNVASAASSSLSSRDPKIQNTINIERNKLLIEKKRNSIRSEEGQLRSIQKRRTKAEQELATIRRSEDETLKRLQRLREELELLERSQSSTSVLSSSQSNRPTVAAATASSTLFPNPPARAIVDQQQQLVSTAINRATAAINSSQSSSHLSIVPRSTATVVNAPPSHDFLWKLDFTRCDLRYRRERDIIPPTTFQPSKGYTGSFKISPKESGRKTLLRICAIDKKKSQQMDYVHHGIKIMINQRIPCVLNQGQKKYPFKGPLDITDICHESAFNILQISLEQSLPQGASSEPLPLECGISLVHVFKNDFNQSINMLRFQETKYARSAEETRKLIMKQFSSDDACGVTEVKISLQCPYSKQRLKVPCFGTGCNHLIFFCGSVFLELNQNRDNWSCPVCRKPIGLDDLRVDGLLKQILNDTPQSCNQIEFDKYCKWKAVEEGTATALKTESKPIAVIQAVSFAVEEEVIDLIDSDDEAPPPSVPPTRVAVTPLPSTTTRVVSNSTHVVVSRETSEKESPPHEDTSSNSRSRDRHDDDSEDEVVGPRRTTRSSNRTKRTIREIDSDEEGAASDSSTSSSSSSESESDSYSSSPSPPVRRKQPPRKRPGPMSKTAPTATRKKRKS